MLVSFFDRSEICAIQTLISLLLAKKYTSDHEWIIVDNGVGTFGITDHAQQALGDIVFVESPTVGDSVKLGGKKRVNH